MSCDCNKKKLIVWNEQSHNAFKRRGFRLHVSLWPESLKTVCELFMHKRKLDLMPSQWRLSTVVAVRILTPPAYGAQVWTLGFWGVGLCAPVPFCFPALGLLWRSLQVWLAVIGLSGCWGVPPSLLGSVASWCILVNTHLDIAVCSLLHKHVWCIKYVCVCVHVGTHVC